MKSKTLVLKPKPAVSILVRSENKPGSIGRFAGGSAFVLTPCCGDTPLGDTTLQDNAGYPVKTLLSPHNACY